MTLVLILFLTACGPAPRTAVHIPSHKKTTNPPPAPPPTPDAVAVMIENAPQARPQSGLDGAQVIYEMMAEGGITRYMAFFNLNDPSLTLGPVRSARIYYVDIIKTYGLPLAHAGGNVDALAAIKALPIPNLDGLFGASPWFWRISSRKAPHNLYTDLGHLVTAISRLRVADTTLRMWPTGALPPGGTAAPQVNVLWAENPLYSYRTSFAWANNGYTYFINGSPDVQADGNTVSTDNVIILEAVVSPDPDLYTVGSIKYALTSGKGYLLRGGQRWAITWSFGSDGFSFDLQNGQPAPLAPGKVFVQVLPEPTSPTFPAAGQS